MSAQRPHDRRRPGRGARAARAAALVVVAAAGPAAAQAPARFPVRAGVTVRPDTVTVGDPFVVQVRVAAPAGASVTFPTATDSGAAVALLDPPREARAAAPDGGVDVTATYRAAAWDVGPVPLGLPDVVVRVGGEERRVPLAGTRLVVRSVLPADSARRVPRPVRDPVPDPGLWWLPWLIAALVLAGLVGLLAWLAARAARRRRTRVPADRAYQEALAAFTRIERMQLVAAGEGGRHLVLTADVARDYLAARVPGADPAQTSGELLAALATNPDVPADRLAALLADADLVKFANARVAPEAAASAGAAARALVEEVEAALRARAEQEAAAAAEAARAEREAQRRYEEEQRRAARRAERAARARRDGSGDDDEPPQERAA